MERNIKNPSLVPEWFIYSGSKVMGVSGADGRQYYFVGSSEKGEDGKTPAIRINAEKGYIWESRYAPDDWNEIPGSPAASGLVGPQGETGLSGDSVKVDSIVNENGGTTVTLAWGKNETSSFFVPSGLSGANGKDGTNGTDGKDGISPTVTTATIGGTPGGIKVTISGADGEHQFDIMNGQDGTGASYSFDEITLSGNGSSTDIGVNTTASMNFINSSAKSATYADQYFDTIDDKYYSISQQFNNKVDKPDITQSELNQKYLVYSTLSGAGQPKGWTDILDKVYSKSEADGTFIKKNLDSTLSGDGSNENNKLGLNTANIDPNKQYAWTTEGWEEVAAQSNLSAGTDLKIDENNVISVDTNGTANNTATNNHNFVEGSWTIANGYNCHAEGAGTSALGYGIHAQGMWTCFSSSKWGDDKHIDTDIYWAVGAGATVEGYCNATTSCPMSGTTGESNYGAVHGGILKVIGNGYIEHDQYPDPDAHLHTHHPSDALILYRDGSLSAAGKISAAGVELGNYTPTLPLNIGNNNTVTNDSIGVIGNNSYAGVKSIVMSYLGATAISNSLAIGDGNYASANAGAFGWLTTATDYAFAVGHYVSAHDYSVAFGHGDSTNISKADRYSIVNGDAVTAINYSQAFGRGLIASGNPDGKGIMVIGGWNKTSADALFVVGNGTANTNEGRKDALVVYTNGTIQAGNGTYANGEACFTQGAWTVAKGHMSHAEGVATSAIGYGIHTEGCWTKFSSDSAVPNNIAASNNCGVFVGGFANATTSHTYGEATAHNGVLAVYGNGYRNSGNITGSDAYILYRDGTVSAKQFQNANGTDSVGSYSGINNIQVYPAGTSTANFPNDGVLRIVLES